jgi:hypothetical protein
MSYITRYIDEMAQRKSGDSWGRVPAKPAKPPIGLCEPGFAGSAGSACEEFPNSSDPPFRRGTRPEATDAQHAPWPPRPAEIGAWPIPWRQRWGELSNQLEDQGIPFPESERRAFARVKAEMDARA